MSNVDGLFDDLIAMVGVPAAKQARDDVVKAGNIEGIDLQAVMVQAGLLAVHGNGAYRRAAIEHFVEQLDVGQNDVLIVHMGEDDVNDQEAIDAWMSIAHALGHRFNAVQGKSVTVVLASASGRLEDLPERTMVDSGWFRAGRIRQALVPWEERLDLLDGAPAEDQRKALWDLFNEMSRLADGVPVHEHLDREEALEVAARHYRGGLDGAVKLVAFLADADEEEFTAWREHAADVLSTFEEGRARYAEVLDPRPASDFVDDEDPKEETTDADEG